jgi:hypothetical protein
MKQDDKDKLEMLITACVIGLVTLAGTTTIAALIGFFAGVTWRVFQWLTI